jgi:hypothetical protein
MKAIDALIDVQIQIQKLIGLHNDKLKTITDENQKQFVKGVITGLGRSLLTIPLIETLEGCGCDSNDCDCDSDNTKK